MGDSSPAFNPSAAFTSSHLAASLLIFAIAIVRSHHHFAIPATLHSFLLSLVAYPALTFS